MTEEFIENIGEIRRVIVEATHIAQSGASKTVVSGALIEVLQETLTTKRLGEVHDWLAEVIGVGLALLALAVLERLAQPRSASG